MKYTKEDIIKRVEDEGVKFIRLQFADMFGQLKNVAITQSQLSKALDNQCMFDGSSIEGFVRIEESDMYLYPDLDTFVIFPWTEGSYKTARLICDIYRPDGKPFEGDPRYVLKKVLKEASDMGYTFNVGPECEFFLFKTDEDGQPTTKTNDMGSYFELGPTDSGETARRDMCITLEDMGFEIEASHHEVACGQHEIDFKYSDALNAADHIVTFKLAVKTVASNHKLHATFMPKPIYGACGSGMHVNMSLCKKDGSNAFYDKTTDNELSKEALAFIAGILEHAKGFTLITNPLVNSYKRLVPGFEAPVYIAWSAENRSPLVRIPCSRGAGTRVELRNPDPAANPYLVMAVCLACGLDGIKKGMAPRASTDVNIYEMSDFEREEASIDMLPNSLEKAIRATKKDPFIKEVLGNHIFEKYIAHKTLEWEEYRKMVTPWEMERYLTRY